MKILNSTLVKLDKKVPVYDLHMKQTNPCFSLDVGIISHNSVPAGGPMRAIMIPRRPNHVLVHADYSALEVTVLSKVANDPALIQVFLDGKDIHRYAASKIFGKPEAEITSEERRFSKSCTFGIYMERV